jgi:hypothetical protein
MEVGPGFEFTVERLAFNGRRASPEIRFWGYTPGCFPKSGEVVEKIGVAGGTKPGVWKVLYLKEFGVGLVRTGVGGRVMLQDNTG